MPTLLSSHERLDAMIALRTGRVTDLATPVTVLNRVLARRFDGIVVTSAFARAEFATVAAQAGTPLHQVPLGVDLDTFRPPPQGRPRPQGPPAGDVLRLVHAGRLSREKSPHLAVATAVALHERGHRVHLDVYGTGPHREARGDRR